MPEIAPTSKNVVWPVAKAAVDVTLDPDPPLRTGKRSAPYHMTHFPYEPLAAPAVVRKPSGEYVSRASELQPRLAISWRPEDDFRSWLVDLRPGVRSSLGNELTSADLKWAWDRVFALRGVGLWRSRNMAGVASSDDIVEVDRYQVRFNLTGPNPEFPQYFVFATNNVVDSSVARSHATDSDPWATAWLADNVAGHGAFRLAERSDESIVFTSRPDYWAGPPGLESVRLVAVDRRESAFQMIERGDANVLTGLFPDEIARFEHQPGMSIRIVQANHATLEFNWADPPFDDQQVRRAVSFALPYRRIIDEVYCGRAALSKSPIGPYASNYSGDFWKYDTDLDTARRLIADSRYPAGFATELFIQPGGESDRFARIAVAALAKIGISVSVRLESERDESTHPPLWFKNDCGHALSEGMYDLGHDYEPPRGMWTGMFIRNQAWVDALRAIRKAPSEQQPDLYRQFQRTILEFAPCVHIAELQAGVVVRGPLDAWAFGQDSLGLNSTVWTGDRQILPER